MPILCKEELPSGSFLAVLRIKWGDPSRSQLRLWKYADLILAGIILYTTDAAKFVS